MTYEERVQKVKKSLYASATCFAPFKEVTGNAYWQPAAKGAIAMQAQAIREFAQGFASEQHTEEYLKQNGYIQDQEADGQ